MRQYGYIIYIILLVIGFGGVLLDLWTHALNDKLHSHIILVPPVSAWILWNIRASAPTDYRISWHWAVLLVVSGGLLMVLSSSADAVVSWSRNDLLAARVAAFLSFAYAGGFVFLGCQWMKAVAFPACFLLFLIPLPDPAVAVFEVGLMRASATVSAALFHLMGVPVFRNGQILELPGMVLEVAQECSGIRSTWVLLITGTLASYLLLESSWKRLLLIAVVVPLGILRNGARIVVIGYLCVRHGPEMIDSWIHSEGGPYFFLASLVPLFGVLWWLRRKERSVHAPNEPQAATGQGEVRQTGSGSNA